MKKAVKILGTGCPKCKAVTSIVEEVIQENHVDATMEKVEDIMDIMKFGVAATPAVVVNNDVKITGRIPSKEEVLSFLND